MDELIGPQDSIVAISQDDDKLVLGDHPDVDEDAIAGGAARQAPLPESTFRWWRSFRAASKNAARCARRLGWA